MTLLTCECSCTPETLYGWGDYERRAEFYATPEEASLAALNNLFAGRLYWGVHLNGAHLLWRHVRHYIKARLGP